MPSNVQCNVSCQPASILFFSPTNTGTSKLENQRKPAIWEHSLNECNPSISKSKAPLSPFKLSDRRGQRQPFCLRTHRVRAQLLRWLFAGGCISPLPVSSSTVLCQLHQDGRPSSGLRWNQPLSVLSPPFILCLGTERGWLPWSSEYSACTAENFRFWNCKSFLSTTVPWSLTELVNGVVRASLWRTSLYGSSWSQRDILSPRILSSLDSHCAPSTRQAPQMPETIFLMNHRIRNAGDHILNDSKSLDVSSVSTTQAAG